MMNKFEERMREQRERLNKRYREEGWGKITDKALCIDPYDVESAARCVARWSYDHIKFLNHLIEDLVAHEGAEGFSADTHANLEKWDKERIET